MSMIEGKRSRSRKPHLRVTLLASLSKNRRKAFKDTAFLQMECDVENEHSVLFIHIPVLNIFSANLHQILFSILNQVSQEVILYLQQLFQNKNSNMQRIVTSERRLT